MSRIIVVLFLLAGLNSAFAARGTPAGTVFTNSVTITSLFMSNFTTNYILMVGSYYGLSAVSSISNLYTGFPNSIISIPLYLTNQGNDADSNVQYQVVSYSNSPGYTGSTPAYYFQDALSNYSSNYFIPFSVFGESAIYNNNLVVSVPVDANLMSTNYFTIVATTLSNSNHVAGFYNGYNAKTYGGFVSVTQNIVLVVLPKNKIMNILASDGIDTINVFNMSTGLRKSRNTIVMDTEKVPDNVNSLRLWYGIDGATDGPGVSNTSDTYVNMVYNGGKSFTGILPESVLSGGSYLTFLFQIDGAAYITNLSYKLYNLASQSGYSTVLMNNVLDYQSEGSFYIKLPDKVIGKSAKVKLYSIAGDLVRNIFEGTVDEQVLKWDTKDRLGSFLSKGMYFIVIEAGDVKEVRKIFVK